ncbi:hypothetical protein [Helicobacter sp. MIT 14-3879]|uniref:hypothetical protein n=1 Tax=Helicobacter sp. MIT 14-3879 TaxID=2040649 RepID=UPI000E1F1893|nr:hypothetical protein [Helicobacter sp. MIT 14-3879]RDU61526.1 hypothetical protein CQA44_08680 [Helicobacter sp. MIT 14-3879]
MALNSIGNLTYINQASSATSAIQANSMPHQTPLNHNIFHEQMQKVEEVRPTEQTHKTEDREGNGKREFEEKEQENQTENEQEFEEAMMLAQDSKSNTHNSTSQRKKITLKERVVTEDTMLMRPESYLLDVKG